MLSAVRGSDNTALVDVLARRLTVPFNDRLAEDPAR